MKKVVCLIAVLALTAGVYAQNVTITADVVGDTITLNYDATGSAAMPVGFSFIVDAGTASLAAAGDVGLADSFFDVFIDFAADDPAAYQAGANPTTGVLAGAHPIAKADAAGAAAFPATVFAVSAAELANVATIPATGTICTLKMTGTGTVCFSEDTLRGGVVDTAGAAMAVTLPECVEVGAQECLYVDQVWNYTGPGAAVSLTVTQAMVDRWNTLGKPACWCCLAQKAGNYAYATTSATRVDAQDMAAVKNSWFKSVGQAGYNPCADGNLSGRVDAADMALVKTHWFLQTGGCQ